jgi:hypothetical protein
LLNYRRVESEPGFPALDGQDWMPLAEFIAEAKALIEGQSTEL